MSAQAWSAIIAGLAVIGQAVNLALNLKLRNAILESERRILEHADCRYVHRDVCEAEMKAIDQRLSMALRLKGMA